MSRVVESVAILLIPFESCCYFCQTKKVGHSEMKLGPFRGVSVYTTVEETHKAE